MVDPCHIGLAALGNLGMLNEPVKRNVNGISADIFTISLNIDTKYTGCYRIFKIASNFDHLELPADRADQRHEIYRGSCKKSPQIRGAFLSLL